MERCPVLGVSGEPTIFWLEAQALGDQAVRIYLRWGRQPRRPIADLPLETLPEVKQRAGKTLPVGYSHFGYEADGDRYRFDYMPPQGPDWELRLWVRRTDLEELCGSL